jgi:hypothetical protein
VRKEAVSRYADDRTKVANAADSRFSTTPNRNRCRRSKIVRCGGGPEVRKEAVSLYADDRTDGANAADGCFSAATERLKTGL